MIKYLLREPLIHFLLLGAVVFIFFDVTDDGAANQLSDAIVVNKNIEDHLSTQFHAIWQRQPTDEERATLIEGFIREEILVREARALGFDQNDEVIRNRLRQKMEALATSVAEGREPSDAELAAFFAENSANYALGGQVAFEQVYLGQAPTAEEVNAARAALAGGTPPEKVGARSLIPLRMTLSDRRAVDAVFGAAFFPALQAPQIGVWSGPIRSGSGAHLVRVYDRRNPERPVLVCADIASL
jgi:hypothetical protein